MRAGVSINLHNDDGTAPHADVLALDDGRGFISLWAADDLSIILPGFDGQSAACARLMAAALTKAADTLQQRHNRSKAVSASCE